MFLTSQVPCSGAAASGDGSARLDIIAQAVFRSNEGWHFDTKGLVSPQVHWNGASHLCKTFASLCTVNGQCQKMVCSMSWVYGVHARCQHDGLLHQEQMCHPCMAAAGCLIDVNISAATRQLRIDVCAVMAGKLLKDWRVFPLPLDNLDRLRLEEPSQAVGVHSDATSGPTFYRCVFWVSEPRRSRVCATALARVSWNSRV